MKTVVLFFILVWSSFLSYATIFDQGVKAYNERNYQQAAKIFEELIRNDQTSSNVYYNLGNCYFRMNQLAPAIASYNKALRFDPSNEDAAYNLKLANERTVDNYPESTFVRSSWLRITGAFSLKTLSLISIAAILIFCILFYLFIFSSSIPRRKLYFFSALFFFVAFLVSYVIGRSQLHHINDHDEAIVSAATLTVKSEPGTGKDLFILHEGTKVQLRSKTTDWIEISLPDGKKGWVPYSSIIII